MGAIVASGLAQILSGQPISCCRSCSSAAFSAAGQPPFHSSKRCVDEVLTSLMLVYAPAMPSNIWFTALAGTDRGFPITNEFSGALITASYYRHSLPDPDSKFPAGVLIHLLVAPEMGYEIRVTGENPDAACGMNYQKIALLVMLISGGLADLARGGRWPVFISACVRRGISPGYGFAIIVAWLAPYHWRPSDRLPARRTAGGQRRHQITLNLPAATVRSSTASSALRHRR